MASINSKGFLRKGLVVFQFTVASVFIFTSVVIYKQLDYVQNKNLGFNGDQVLAVDLPNDQTWDNRATVRQEIAKIPGVQSVSISGAAPAAFNIGWGVYPEDVSPQEEANSEESLSFKPAVIDYSFLEILDIKLIAGRNFSRDLISDREKAFILNREAVEALGWTPDQAIGKSFSLAGVSGEVIGVVQNFHISDLHEPIKPVAMHLKESKRFSTDGILMAKLSSTNIGGATDSVIQKMKEFAPAVTINYQFLDDKFDALYRADRRMGTIFGLFTLVAVIVACLGLLGLSIFSANSRVKEIGIRKVLGATIANIVSLLSKDFLKLVLVGFVIATPLAWYGANLWLQSFAYKIEIGLGIFAMAGGAALFIALATVSWQSIRAALANPVESLRNE